MKTVPFLQRARHPFASAHPGLWRDMELFLAPAMGCQGSRLIDCSPHSRFYYLSYMPLSHNWWEGHGPLGKGCRTTGARANYVAGEDVQSADGHPPIACDGEMTIAMYLKIDNYPPVNAYLAACRDNPTTHVGDFQLTYSPDGALTFSWSDDSLCTSSLYVYPGTWYNIAVRRWGAAPGLWYVDFWVNGCKSGTLGNVMTDPNGDINSYTMHLFGGPTRRSLDCCFAAVGLWNRCLHAAEVLALNADPLAPIRPGPEEPLLDAEWMFPFETCSEVID